MSRIWLHPGWEDIKQPHQGTWSHSKAETPLEYGTRTRKSGENGWEPDPRPGRGRVQIGHPASAYAADLQTEGLWTNVRGGNSDGMLVWSVCVV